MNGAEMMLENLMRNPQIANNPRIQEVMRLRKNGDIQGIQRIGTNICQQNGVSFDAAAEQFQRLMQSMGYNK